MTIPAVICGHLALSSIKRSGGQLTGRGCALFGVWLGYIGMVLFVALAGMVGSYLLKRWPERKRASAALVAKSFDLTQTAIPAFPGLPDFVAIEGSKVRVGQIDLAGTNPGAPSLPGSQMKMRIYLPPGNHAAGSLACVLVSPAGTNLLSGNDLDALDSDSYHDEALPYAEAGLAVVFYSLDGAVEEDADVARIGASYQRFKAAGAGIVNGRNALEYALRQMPMVDAQRIFCAGHSSAGTGSLLLASHESRLRGCIAYAPAIDVVERLKSLSGNPAMSLAFPDFSTFLELSSPSRVATALSMPVYLFGAKDDSTVDYKDIARFAQALQKTNPHVAMVSVETGGHYEPMIAQGIPGAIRWIQTMSAPLPPIESKPGSTATPAAP